MDALIPNNCPECKSQEIREHTTYTIKNGQVRREYHCERCGAFFSETKDTPLAGLHRPLSFIQMVLDAINNGMGINAACKTFHVGKNSIYRWQTRLAALKPVLLLYALCHQFIKQVVEGDEVYTKVDKNRPPDESPGWTIVLMERASRFIWELACEKKERALFKKAMRLLAQVIDQTDDLALLTDGERRYGNLLFELCQETLRTGKRGRPKHVLRRGVKVRVKNKGSQAHKRGRKRPKYQAPHHEHPDTVQDLANHHIHANHIEAFNAALRRRLACYRRRTNTYAKNTPALQRRLDGFWVLHNFVRTHFTTKRVPAVALGILEQGLTWEQLFRVRCVSLT